jgi:hypothetical protein
MLCYGDSAEKIPRCFGDDAAGKFSGVEVGIEDGAKAERSEDENVVVVFDAMIEVDPRGRRSGRDG